jgi:5-methyltetrahydropteroyltriglutamate--homocysteine methyltransferase
MIFSRDRILTTHTGSLPRPPGLTHLHVQNSRGATVDANEMQSAVHAAVRDVVAKQLSAGIDIGNNGEQPRDNFFRYAAQRMSGFGGSWNRATFGDFTRYPLFFESEKKRLASVEAVSGRNALPKAIGPVAYSDRGPIDRECAELREVVAEMPGFTEVFMSSPSPGIIAAGMKNEYYDSEQAYLDAIAAALSIEYQAIVDSGFVLQLDCPELGLEYHISYYEKPLSVFLDFVESVVAAINRALERLPRDRVRLHLCWGSYEGPHDLDIPLSAIWPLVKRANVGAFVLPFANPRHAHEYRLLEGQLSDDQLIVAGVIDTTSNFIEHPEVVADRLQNVAAVMGDPRRVIAGTDCGFDSSAGAGRVPADVAWAKMNSLVEGARIASRRLFEGAGCGARSGHGRR